jgi:hypothetical protein
LAAYLFHSVSRLKGSFLYGFEIGGAWLPDQRLRIGLLGLVV